jgi:hypothetical protein
MSENKKSYYAIIPANVRYDERLTPNAKLLYGEITALCNEKGYCWATNRYFAELYKKSNTSISTWISQLKKYGYIKLQIIYKDESKEILHRYISILNEPIQENLNTPIQENLKDNITLINNTMNNTINTIPSDKSSGECSLYQSIFDCFYQLNKNFPYGNGKAEGKAIKHLIEKIPKDKEPEKYLKALISTFWRLRAQDQFFQKQPFSAMVLNSAGIYPRVVDWVEKDRPKTDAEYLSGCEDILQEAGL